MANLQSHSAPVIIVGGGPVGMNVALNLDALGVRSILVNSDAATRMHPKGGTQNSRTMEHYRRLGLAREIRQFGLPADYPTNVGYFTRLNGWELARIVMPSEREKARIVANADSTDQVPEPILRCNQMYVEAFLLKHLATLPRVGLRFGWECVDFSDDGDGVTVELVEVDTGRREILTGHYLVGCDGGASFVRRRLGIRFEGERPLEQAFLGGPMVNSHLRIPNFYERVNRERFWHYWTINREIRSNLVSLNGKDDFVFSTRLRNPDDKPDPVVIARQLRAVFAGDLEVEFLGDVPWTGGLALVAEKFARGRVFMAGDSIHLFSPTGGFGMNTGIDDAANLSWKLAAALQGWGGPKLLDTYESERRPIAFRNTRASHQLARNVGDVPVGEAIEEDSAAGIEARAAASRFLAIFGEEFASIGIQLGARYDESPIVVSDGTDPPPDDPKIYVPSACPGGRAPHLWLEDRSSLFDHLGPGFTLLRLPGSPTDTGPLERAASARGLPLSVFTVTLPEAWDLYGNGLALLRPDQHVTWRGDALPGDCDAFLARVTGW